jgi:hypothetical protein
MGWPIFQQRVFFRYSLAALAENSVYSIPEAVWYHSLDWTLPWGIVQFAMAKPGFLSRLCPTTAYPSNSPAYEFS